MNSTVGKKIGNAGLLIGGLLGLIGAVLAIVNSAAISINGVIGMSVMARIGSIIMFISAIAIVAATVMGKDLKKGGAIAKMVFAVLAFVGQFLINPYTSWQALISASFGGSARDVGMTGFIGFIFIAVSGLTLLIMGIVGLASKNKAMYNNGMMGQQCNNNNNNNNMMGQ